MIGRKLFGPTECSCSIIYLEFSNSLNSSLYYHMRMNFCFHFFSCFSIFFCILFSLSSTGLPACLASCSSSFLINTSSLLNGKFIDLFSILLVTYLEESIYCLIALHQSLDNIHTVVVSQYSIVSSSSIKTFLLFITLLSLESRKDAVE